MAKCMKCGGMKAATKMKKMQKGGMKTTVGNKDAKTFIAGIPNSGPTGPNLQGIDTMQKGGAKKTIQSNKKMIDPRVREVYVNTQQKSQTLNTIPPNVREFLGNAKNGNVVTANNQYNVILKSSTPRFTKEHEGGIFSFFSFDR